MSDWRQRGVTTADVVLITAPTVDVVTLAECKTGLGIAGAGQDAMLPGLIAAAAGVLDPAWGGWLGRALRPQTWELQLSGFPDCEQIKLPYPPLMSVDSVKYDNGVGVEQTLALGAGYRVFGLGGHRKAAISPPAGGSWPAARCDRGSVRIRFTAGYPVAAGADPGPEAPEKMPAPLKQAVLLGVRMLLSSVERNLFLSEDTVEGVGTKRYVVSDAANKQIEAATGSLLANYRMF
jgi:uncharacterized phiE125 gp8 family phage protein